MGLMAPSGAQQTALKQADGWDSEARQLLETCLDLKLVTRGKTWSPIAEEVWRFVLFSEFVFDLPGDLPDALQTVPRASEHARHLVESICEDLRDKGRTQNEYITRAERIESDLQVAAHCKSIEDLGSRDTFPFEERSFLARAIKAIEQDDPDTVREILESRRQSVWIGNGDSQAQWALLQSASDLIDACDRCQTQLVEHTSSQAALTEYYVTQLREVDRGHREFELAAGDYIDGSSVMGPVLKKARDQYKLLANSANTVFLRHLTQGGYPTDGYLSNADVFDQVVVPAVQESGRRVALLLVDALRYELGVELEHELADSGKVSLQPAMAALPTVTPVGMSSLLPGAGNGLRVVDKAPGFMPMLGDTKTETAAQRMEVLKKAYGNRFSEMQLQDFLNATETLPQTVELLVLRTTTIDTYLESNPADALPTIGRTLNRIRAAIYRLAQQGFSEAIIATDHGFVLNTDAQAGDVCKQPEGTWTVVHGRSLLGTGTEDSASFVVPCEKVGIRGEFESFGGPRVLIPYKKGLPYFHGGASLQECVVPVLTVALRQQVRDEVSKASVDLAYRNGARAITMRNPVLDVTAGEVDLFASGALEILLEARDKEGNLRGEVKVGRHVNPATGTVSLSPGETLKVALTMDFLF